MSLSPMLHNSERGLGGDHRPVVQERALLPLGPPGENL